jgi:hypothetical protein
MNKKVYAILGGILLLIIIVVGFILFLKSKSATPVATTTPTTTGAGTIGNFTPTPTPTSAAGTFAPTVTATPTPVPTAAPKSASVLTKLSTGTAIGPAFSYDNQSMWYFSPDGHLYKVNLQTELKQEYPLPSNSETTSVIWPLVGNDFITVSTTAAGANTFSYYSSASKTFTVYPSNVTSVDFLPDGIHVAYEWVDSKTGKGELQVASANLTGYKNIAALPDVDDVVKVSPLGNRALAYSASAPTNGKLYLITLDTDQIYTLATAASNQAIWAPSGQNFIWNKNVTSPTVPSISADEYYGDLTTEKDTDLKIQTPVSKISFDSTGQNIYYAVSYAGGAGDTLFRMNLQTLRPASILTSAAAGTQLDAYNLLISSDGNTLYFRNQANGFLYSTPVGGTAGTAGTATNATSGS